MWNPGAIFHFPEPWGRKAKCYPCLAHISTFSGVCALSHHSYQVGPGSAATPPFTSPQDCLVTRNQRDKDFLLSWESYHEYMKDALHQQGHWLHLQLAFGWCTKPILFLSYKRQLYSKPKVTALGLTNMWVLYKAGKYQTHTPPLLYSQGAPWTWYVRNCYPLAPTIL